MGTRCRLSVTNDSETCWIHNKEVHDCSICYSEIKQKIILPDCKHHFCKECIYEWLCTNQTCPLCRTEVNEDVQKRSNEYCILKGVMTKIDVVCFDLSRLDDMDKFLFCKYYLDVIEELNEVENGLEPFLDSELFGRIMRILPYKYFAVGIILQKVLPFHQDYVTYEKTSTFAEIRNGKEPLGPKRYIKNMFSNFMIHLRHDGLVANIDFQQLNPGQEQEQE